MKVTMYMVISVNGIIAKEGGNEDFISWTGFEEHVRLAKEFGNFIWGRKTHQNAQKIFKPSDLQLFDPFVKVVVSTTGIKVPPDFHLANSPTEALSFLQEKGFKKALLIGGATLNTAFAKLGLINEIIFLIEPAIVGKGIPVFAQDDFEMKLKLIQTEKLGARLIKLHYKVLK